MRRRLRGSALWWMRRRLVSPKLPSSSSLVECGAEPLILFPRRGMNTNRECEPCESGTSGTVGSIFILLGMIAGFCVVLAVIAKLWSDFPLKHLMRCSVQPMRILITYSQVTSQLGDVLNFV